MNYRGLRDTLETEHAQASATETEVTGDVEKVLQMFSKDCHQHEEKIATEKIQCKQEAAAERERQEQETER